MWTNKHCGLQVAILCNETWDKMSPDQKCCTGRVQTFPCGRRPARCKFIMFVPACRSHYSMLALPVVPHTLHHGLPWWVFWCRLWITDRQKNARATPWATFRIIKTLSLPWSEKIEIFLRETEEVKMLRLSLCALHSTYKEEWQCECVLWVHTPLPSHTHF